MTPNSQPVGNARLHVLIPYHKGIDYLRETLASLCAQTSREWYASVVDDSGTDDAELLVRSLNVSQIEYARNPLPNGIAGNWNYAISLVRSQLFCLLHADDVLEPDYVTVMIDGATRHSGAAIYFCHVTLIDEKGRMLFHFPDWVKSRIEGRAAHRETTWQGEAAASRLLKGSFIFCPTVVYRTDRLTPDPFEIRYGQVLDLDLFLRLLLKGEQFVGMPRKLYRYRRHAQNATALQTQNLTRFSEEFALYSRVTHTLKAQGWIHAASVARRKQILVLHLGYRLLLDLCRLQFRTAKEKLLFLIRQLSRS
jgi:glycosyltransferase involved in cell wall biosynthesis